RLCRAICGIPRPARRFPSGSGSGSGHGSGPGKPMRMRESRVQSCLASASFWCLLSTSINFDFDPPVLRATFTRLIILDRFALAESLARYAARVYTSLGEEVSRGVGPAL